MIKTPNEKNTPPFFESRRPCFRDPSSPFPLEPQDTKKQKHTDSHQPAPLTVPTFWHGLSLIIMSTSLCSRCNCCGESTGSLPGEAAAPAFLGSTLMATLSPDARWVPP